MARIREETAEACAVINPGINVPEQPMALTEFEPVGKFSDCRPIRTTSGQDT